MSNDTPDYGEVIIGTSPTAMRFKLAAPMLPVAVDRLAPKVTVGDYSIDSNDLLSAWVISDSTGGHGVADLREGVDDSRYRFGDIYTRRPRQYCKPFQTANTSLASGSVFHLGDLYTGGNWSMIASGGTDLYKDNVDTTNNLAGVPASKGVMYSGSGASTYFYVPMGNNGYAVYDGGATFANINGAGDTDNFQAFCIWDDKIIGITNGGQLYYATAAANPTVWTSYGTGGKLDASHEPKALHVYYNRAGESAVHVVTGSGVWVFDASTPRLYLIPDFASVHPYFGVASCVWNANLYVAAGLDILEYNGSVVRNIGLSRDDGLPWNYQGGPTSFYPAADDTGYTRDLIPGQGTLYALVRGLKTGGVYYHSMHEWTGIGWHAIFIGSSSNGPVRGLVSRAANQYRLYWGLAGSGAYYYMTLPVSFTNPREAIDNSAFNFGWSGKGNASDPYYLETGKFDGNMKGYRKIANAVELDIRTLPTDHTVVMKYRIDGGTSWTTLGTATTTGHIVLQFGTITADGIYPGITFENIEFRMEFQDPNRNQYTPLVESLVFSFLKVMNPSWSWTVSLDLTAPHADQSPENMLAKLVDLKNSGEFFALKHRNDTYRIRIAQLGGSEEDGQDTRGRYTLNVLEIPTKLGAPT